RRISGRVIDADGEPASAAIVVFEWPCISHSQPTWTATTDSHGRFHLDNAPIGAIKITIEASNQPERIIQQVRPDEGHIDVRLPVIFSVGGSVLDEQTGRSIPKFKLTIGTAPIPLADVTPGEPIALPGDNTDEINWQTRDAMVLEAGTYK